MKFKKHLVFIFMLGAVVQFCGPSEKSETKRRAKFQALLNESYILYPDYKSYFQEKWNENEKSWQAALAVTDEKEKPKQMKAVNDGISALYVALNDYASYQKQIRDEISRTHEYIQKNNAKHNTVQKFIDLYNRSSQEANRAIDNARRMVEQSRPAGYDEGLRTFQTAVKELKAGKKVVEDVHDACKKYVGEREDAELKARQDASKQGASNQ